MTDTRPNNSHKTLYKFNWHDWHKLRHRFYVHVVHYFRFYVGIIKSL